MLACLIRGFSDGPDLCFIAGTFWFEACGLMLDYRAEYVASSSNLADGPSRGDDSVMKRIGAVECLHWKWPEFGSDLGGWMSLVEECVRVVNRQRP